VGFPPSSSTMNRRPTPAAPASSSCRIRQALRVDRTIRPISSGLSERTGISLPNGKYSRSADPLWHEISRAGNMRRFETHKAQKYPDREKRFGAYFSLIHSAFSAKCGSFRTRPFRWFVWLVNRAVHDGFLDFANPCPKAPRPNLSREFTTKCVRQKWGRERLLLRGISRQGLEFAPIPDYPPGSCPAAIMLGPHCTGDIREAIPSFPCRAAGGRSKRSRFITLVQAATKSLTNFRCESSLA